MAKRKAARAKGRSTATKRAGAGRRLAARKAAGRKRVAKTARKGAKKAAVRRVRAAVGRKRAARKTTARKAVSRKASARKAPARNSPALAAAARKAKPVKTTARPSRSAPRKAAAAKTAVARAAPALNRARRTIEDDDNDIVPTPPSSLDLDRSASAIRSGRKGMRERFAQHTETSPALTGGDVDADWESAYSVGDEAPGGDNPTPDQDIVDDIGTAVGVEYQDNEELKGADKVAKRDKNRWELDPASSDDWDER